MRHTVRLPAGEWLPSDTGCHLRLPVPIQYGRPRIMTCVLHHPTGHDLRGQTPPCRLAALSLLSDSTVPGTWSLSMHAPSEDHLLQQSAGQLTARPQLSKSLPTVSSSLKLRGSSPSRRWDTTVRGASTTLCCGALGPSSPRLRGSLPPAYP